MAFDPYLMFDGTCREALSRYQEIFGGELSIRAMSEAPDPEGIPAEQADLVMHGTLTFPGHVLMASDAPEGTGPVQGMYVSFSAADVDEAERVFAALSDGGEVQMPMEEVFWSPRFGMCVDRFGTPWMVGAEPVEAS